MKFASEYLTPIQIVFVRIFFGFIPVLIYALSKGVLNKGHGKHIGHLIVLAMIGTIAYYYGFTKGASLLNSGIVGALSGLTPIFSLLLALVLLAEEKTTVHKIFGIILGFLGILLIARPFESGISDSNLNGIIFTLLGSLSVGASFVYVKKYILPLNIDPTAIVTYQLGLAILSLRPITELNNLTVVLSSFYVSLALIVGLGILGTGIAFILYYYIIEKMGAVKASSVAYVPPIVALIIGVLLAGEQIVFWEYLGSLFILIGLMLVNKNNQKS